MPCFAKLYAELGITRTDIDILVQRLVGLSGGTGVLVHLRHRLHRWCHAADQRVPRGDGRRLGRLRGLRQDRHGRGRSRAHLRLRQSRRPGRWTSPSRCRPTRTRCRHCGPTPTSLAGLQARLGLESGAWTERQMAEVAARTLDRDVDELLAEPVTADPLRAHDASRYTDGAAALILASEERAKQLVANPAWVTGGTTGSTNPRISGRAISPPLRRPASPATPRSVTTARVDIAELYAPFTHQELILRNELRLPDSVRINPSGGALAAEPDVRGRSRADRVRATAILSGGRPHSPTPHERTVAGSRTWWSPCPAPPEAGK